MGLPGNIISRQPYYIFLLDKDNDVHLWDVNYDFIS
ncbi:hypothetical protein C806_04632 [Lachnospiraceae bacterium 3-1]|nr:hypothetical protein C806_04632 [Lachnospiraceae bacterium 3-1]